MKISVDISLYPLQKAYREPILAFIEQLAHHSCFEIHYNSMSTTVIGEYHQIMPILQQALATTLKATPQSVFIIKLSGGCHPD